MNRREQGLAGERFAAQRLQEYGYEIMARNWRRGHWEIDLIARKDDVIAFVEVKLRRAGGLETPAGAVRKTQMRRIVQAAAAFLKEAGLYGSGKVQPRFDVFELTAAGPNSLEIIDYYYMKHAYDLEGLGVFL